MRRFLSALVPMLIGPALAQMPVGEFRVRVSPQEVAVGGSVGFSAETFSVSGDGGWNSEYAIVRKTAAPPDTFLVLVRSLHAGDPIPLGAGYYGPHAVIKAENPGVHLIRFDSTGDYARDMADTAMFTVLPSAGLRPSAPAGRNGAPDRGYRSDGRRVQARQRAPVFAR
jgi:hypothetical protein